MPFIPDSPESRDVVTSVSKVLDVYQIHEVRIDAPPNDRTQTKISVRWSRGYMEGGLYYSGEVNEILLEGVNLLTAMAAAVAPGKSHYDDFRDALWALLQLEGAAPPGVVS